MLNSFCLQLFGIGSVTVGSIGVHYGRNNGGGLQNDFIVGGALLIVAGIGILLIIALAVYGAVGRSRIALGIVC